MPTAAYRKAAAAPQPARPLRVAARQRSRLIAVAKRLPDRIGQLYAVEKTINRSPPERRRHYGTTLRVYDPRIDAWHIHWSDPLRQFYGRQIGRAHGPDIVQLGKSDDGHTRRRLRRERRISLVPANAHSQVFRPASEQTLNRQWKEARLRRVRSRVRCSSVSSA